MAKGRWLGEKNQLTQKQKNNFEALTGITGHRKDMLIRVMEQCAHIQPIISEAKEKELPYHEALKNIDALLTTLKKAKAEMRHLEQEGFSFDGYMFHASDTPNPEIYRHALRRKHRNTSSSTHAILIEIYQSVSRYRDSLPDRISRENTEYTDSLFRIAEVFKNELVGEISSDPNSLFFRVVCFFMNDILKNEINNPQRHIETVIRRICKKQIIEN